MDEHLVGYALGALDPVTQARVDAHVKHSPEARLQLDLIEQAMAPLAADAASFDVPADLARNTLARIAEHHRMLPTAPPTLRHAGANWRRFRWADGLAAAMLLVLVGGIGFPALARQWQSYQRVACANSLRQLHASLSSYAVDHDGTFPRVESAGPRAVAGIFVPILADAGLLGNVRVGCPAAGQAKAAPVSVAVLETMHQTAPEQYRSTVRDLAGGYAYSLGYFDAGKQLAGLRQDSGDRLPLMSDCSADGGNSGNHGGRGQNVLDVGGSVRWCVHPDVGIDGDNIYLNQFRCIQAGVSRIDSVLGVSDARPCPGD